MNYLVIAIILFFNINSSYAVTTDTQTIRNFKKARKQKRIEKKLSRFFKEPDPEKYKFDPVIDTMFLHL